MFLRVAPLTLALMVAMCAGAPSPQSDQGQALGTPYTCECKEVPSNDNIHTLSCHCTKKTGSGQTGTADSDGLGSSTIPPTAMAAEGTNPTTPAGTIATTGYSNDEEKLKAILSSKICTIVDGKSYSTSDFITAETLGSAAACQRMCLEHNRCTGMDYSLTTSRCYLYGGLKDKTIHDITGASNCVRGV